MDYTAEQMAKLIVLAETLLRYKAMTPIKFLPAINIGFLSYEDAANFELALDEAERWCPVRVLVSGSEDKRSFAEALRARPGFVPVDITVDLPSRLTKKPDTV